MNMDFEGRHVVISGGSGALGSAVVGTLLERGARCHIPVLDEGELKRFPHTDHDRVSILTGLDLAAESDAEKFYGAFTSTNPLWASVHCAGGFGMSPIADTSQSDFEQMMRVNAQSCFLACREAVRAIRRGEGRGRIVNVSARPGLVPDDGAKMVAYSASKAAVAAITRALAAELADEAIWVNAVAPSIMNTFSNRQAMPEADHDAWPTVEQVASTIAFLASPGNEVTRGGLVPVYGRC